MKNMKRTTKIVISIFVIVMLLIAIIYLAVAMYFGERFFPGSVINGIDCSLKTVEEAEELIAADVQDYRIAIIGKNDRNEVIEGSDIYFSYVSDGKVQALKDTQNSFMWLYAFFHPQSHEMVAQTTYDKEMLRKAMLNLKAFDEKLITKPEDAYIRETIHSYEMVEEVEGNQPDEEKVYKLLQETVDAGGGELNLVENDCYLKPAVYSDDEKLNQKLNNLKKYAELVITYDMGEKEEVLDYSTFKDWMTMKEDGTATFNWNEMADWMSALNEKYRTFGKEMEFKTSLGETVKLKHETYGWLLDEATEVAELEKIFAKGESVTREPKYLESARKEGKDDIGDTYIEVDYTNQRMWFYKDGELLVDTPVVTGNSTLKHDSPVGIYVLYNKEEQAILKGEDYKTPVDFWLPFCDGVGVHDAKWRSHFGGNLYKTGGSHGCINTPWDKAKIIYENIEIGTPVICYKAKKNLEQGPVAVEQPEETRVIDEEGNEVTQDEDVIEID